MRDPIGASFERLAAARPSTKLVVTPSRSASAADIAAQARAIGLFLEAHHALREPGAIVALAAPDGPAFLAGLIGLRSAEFVALLLDPSAPAEERRRVARELGAVGVLECDDAWPSRIPDWTFSTIPTPARPQLPADAAFIKLTSGSTGSPRGVAVSGAALAADDDQLRKTMGLSAADILLCAVPMAHSYGLSSLALPALRSGATLVRPEEIGPFALMSAADICGATFFPTTPAWIGGLLRLSAPPAWPESVRLTISAGAPMPPETAERFREVFGQRIHTFYGASECGGICYDRDGAAAERGTVGPPVEGVRVELTPIPGQNEPGVGQVLVRSAAAGLGYVPEADPRLGSGRFLSGDIGSWLNNELVIFGRADDLINIRGKKVSPREVEIVIRRVPGVEDVVVMGVPVPGGAGETLRAVVAGKRHLISVKRISSYCCEQLAPHKRPRSVLVVEELPRTARGKLDRAALVAMRGPDTADKTS